MEDRFSQIQSHIVKQNLSKKDLMFLEVTKLYLQNFIALYSLYGCGTIIFRLTLHQCSIYDTMQAVCS